MRRVQNKCLLHVDCVEKTTAILIGMKKDIQ